MKHILLIIPRKCWQNQKLKPWLHREDAQNKFKCQMLCGIGILNRNFAKFTENTCVRDSFLKIWRPEACNKRLWHRCFSVSFVKFLRTPSLQNTSRQLLLTFNRCWFKKPCLLMMPFHCIILNFVKKVVLLLTKDFLFWSFHSCKLFHKRVSCEKTGT